jgi:1-pyrroline-5-carboxylate dehydrogenase
MAAPARAAPGWRATSVAERVRLMKKVARLIEERIYHISAALTLEVGKNRMEALGEVQETADFFDLYAEDFEKHNGFLNPLPDDPLPDYRSRNKSVMKPHGVWVVIAPYNFPFALSGGPVAAALVTGNTVVFKSATDTPWSGRLLADCIRDAGFPPGVFNWLNGSGSVVGETLVQHPKTAGITFTGSFDVGMKIYGKMATGRYPRPASPRWAARTPASSPPTPTSSAPPTASSAPPSACPGRSARRCRACTWTTPSPTAHRDAEGQDRGAEGGRPDAAAELDGPGHHRQRAGQLRSYAQRLREEAGASSPAASADGERDCERLLRRADAGGGAGRASLFREEMFLPIVMLCRVASREEAMQLANDSPLGLTAGVYGNDEDIAYFFENIEAGVTYANRPQGATTGAWPGYQPFGGWKGSGSTGKAIASFYYLQQYLREQSQTTVE